MSFESLFQAGWLNRLLFSMLIFIPLILGIGILKQKKWAWYSQFAALAVLVYSAAADLIIEHPEFSFSTVLQSILSIVIAVFVGVLWKRERVKKWFFPKPVKTDAPDRNNLRALS